MKIFKTKILSIIILGLFLGTFAVSGVSHNDNSTQEKNTEFIIIDHYSKADIALLQTYHVNILETYETMVLVEMQSHLISVFETKGLPLRQLPFRTTLYLNDIVFDFTEGEPEICDELRIDSYDSDEKGLYIVHMIGPIASTWVSQLEQLDVEIIHYVHNYAYHVRMTDKQRQQVSDLYFVDWVGIYHPYYKFNKDINPGMITIGLTANPSQQTLRYLHNQYIIISEAEYEDGYLLIAQIPSMDSIKKIAQITDVVFISEYIQATLHDEMATQVIGGGLWFFDDEDNNPTTPYRLHGASGSYMNQIGYTGEGVTIAVADTGIGDGTIGNAGHLDFTGRVIGGYSYQGGWEDGHGHGTHCSGSAAGDTFLGTQSTVYNNYYSGQGSAPKSELFAVRIFNAAGTYIGPTDVYHMIQIANQNSDAYVHTNSWGAALGGQYDSRSSRFDAAVRGENMVVTTSAGNSGPSYNTIGTPATAKNVITVGGSQPYNPPEGYTNPENMYSSSSRGWTDDNRIKPDVIAPAQRIYSTMPNGGYAYMSGTSMSNPAVAGAAAVTVEWYEEHYDVRPSPAMVKALLINTANQMGGNTEGPIPNRDEGWGMVDISKLQRPLGDPIPFYLFDQEYIFTSSGQVEEHLVMSDRLDEPLKFSLVWTDKEAPAGTGSGRTLINDLHLEVESPTGLIYRGNAFSGGWSVAGSNAMSVFDYSGDGWDDTNNVENVYIHADDVELGIYTVRIKADVIAGDGVNIGYNSQDYALVVYNGKPEIPGNPPQVSVLSPNGGEIWDAHSQQQINWIAVDGDDLIDHIRILYSINDGSSWNLIQTGLTNTGSYEWTVPNHDSTACLVRIRAVDVLGRVGEDSSNDVFTIVGVPPLPPMNLHIDYISATTQVVFDDFSEGTLDDWTIYSGVWDATNNYLQGYGSISTDAQVNGYPVDAYGLWEFDFNLQRTTSSGGQAQNMRIHFIQTDNPDTQASSGYYITINSFSILWWTFGSISLDRIDSGSTAATSIVSSSWSPNTNINTLSVERDETGLFTVYLNDESLGSGVDTTYTTNEYLGFRHSQNLGGEGQHIIHEIRVDVLGEDDDHNLISWYASPDETIGEVQYYTIYRSEYNHGPWDATTQIQTVQAKGLPHYEYIDIGKGMADDIVWWYVVRAMGTNGLEEMNTNAVQEPYDTVMNQLLIDSTNGGTVVIPGEGTFSFMYNSTISLKAVADEGYQFLQWSGDVDTIADITKPETTIHILDDYSITAEFVQSIPMLECTGSLSFVDVKPGDSVTGSFTVKNNGDPLSLLNWEISSYPSWGSWTFTPDSGVGLTPEDGMVTVTVDIIAPNDPQTQFSGQITLINSDDPSETCIIDVALATPVSYQNQVQVFLRRHMQKNTL